MRFINIAITAFVINLTIALFSGFQLIPHMTDSVTITSTETFDGSGQPVNTNESMSYNIMKWANDKEYYNTNIQSNSMQYLRAGGDFIMGLNMFYSLVVKGVVIPGVTLRNFGMPIQIVWYFTAMIYFIYVCALLEFISNRQILER